MSTMLHSAIRREREAPVTCRLHRATLHANKFRILRFKARFQRWHSRLLIKLLPSSSSTLCISKLIDASFLVKCWFDWRDKSFFPSTSRNSIKQRLKNSWWRVDCSRDDSLYIWWPRWHFNWMALITALKPRRNFLSWAFDGNEVEAFAFFIKIPSTTPRWNQSRAIIR